MIQKAALETVRANEVPVAVWKAVRETALGAVSLHEAAAQAESAERPEPFFSGIDRFLSAYNDDTNQCPPMPRKPPYCPNAAPARCEIRAICSARSIFSRRSGARKGFSAQRSASCLLSDFRACCISPMIALTNPSSGGGGGGAEEVSCFCSDSGDIPSDCASDKICAILWGSLRIC